MKSAMQLFDENRATGEILSINLADKNLAIEFAWCPSGSFKLGSPHGPLTLSYKDKEPILDIVLTKGFWIATKPITRRLSQAISDTVFGLAARYETSLDSPVSQLTWQEAHELCNELSQKIITTTSNHIDFDKAKHKVTLPTQAQWEYACRAGTDSIWFFGNDSADLVEYAWYDDRSGTLPEVGLKNPNPWGLYDVYGMVYEWCLDHDLPYQFLNTLTDPVVDDIHDKIKARKSRSNITIGVVRGGCVDRRADSCTSAYREGLLDYNSQNDLTGVRPVLIQI